MLSMDRMQATRIAQGTGEKNKRVLAIESVKIVTSRGDPASRCVGDEDERCSFENGVRQMEAGYTLIEDTYTLPTATSL